jgi:hypothetical protein
MSCHDSCLLEDASVSTILLHCDNRGVVLHGNDPHGPLKDGQKQADLVRLLKSYSRLAYPVKLNGSTSKVTPTITYLSQNSVLSNNSTFAATNLPKRFSVNVSPTTPSPPQYSLMRTSSSPLALRKYDHPSNPASTSTGAKPQHANSSAADTR